MRFALISSFANAFDVSIRAAALLGPNTAMPACRNSSTTPASLAASWPMTVRSIRSC